MLATPYHIAWVHPPTCCYRMASKVNIDRTRTQLLRAPEAPRLFPTHPPSTVWLVAAVATTSLAEAWV